MAEKTYFTDHNQPAENIKGIQQNLEAKIDFSLYPVTAGDTCRLLNVPAGAIVTKVDSVLVTAEGAACTMDIGDGTTATLFNSNVNLNTAAGTHEGTDPATETTVYATGGKYYATAGHIIGTMDHDTDTAVLWVSADYKILNKPHA